MTCGKPVTSGTSFSLDGALYKMDLCDDDKAELKDILAPYLIIAQRGTATKVVKRAVFVGPGGTPYTSQDVREWFEKKGKPISPIGRIPNHQLEQYEREALADAK